MCAVACPARAVMAVAECSTGRRAGDREERAARSACFALRFAISLGPCESGCARVVNSQAFDTPCIAREDAVTQQAVAPPCPCSLRYASRTFLLGRDTRFSLNDGRHRGRPGSVMRRNADDSLIWCLQSSSAPPARGCLFPPEGGRYCNIREHILPWAHVIGITQQEAAYNERRLDKVRGSEVMMLLKADIQRLPRFCFENVGVQNGSYSRAGGRARGVTLLVALYTEHFSPPRPLELSPGPNSRRLPPLFCVYLHQSLQHGQLAVPRRDRQGRRGL